MDDKYEALMRNKTWTFVPHSPVMNRVDSKWVFKIKHSSDETT